MINRVVVNMPGSASCQGLATYSLSVNRSAIIGLVEAVIKKNFEEFVRKHQRRMITSYHASACGIGMTDAMQSSK